MTGQSKRHSVLESLTNIAVGAGVAFTSQVIIFPFYGLHCSTKANLEITAWFTLISFIRSYLLRRWFNRKTVVSSASAAGFNLADYYLNNPNEAAKQAEILRQQLKEK